MEPPGDNSKVSVSMVMLCDERMEQIYESILRHCENTERLLTLPSHPPPKLNHSEGVEQFGALYNIAVILNIKQ